MNATKTTAKKRGTKSALLTSLLSLLLCVTMLIGTTFAWFTDSVTSGENQIIAGNLDVDVEYYDTTDSSWKTIAGSDSLFDKNALWEPGHTEYVALRIVNKGTLAFNYALDVTPVTEQAGENQAGDSFKLSDYLVFGTSEPAATQVTYADRAAARSAAGTTWKLNQTDLRRTGVLYAASDTNKPTGGMSEVYTTLVVYMPETVGNEANYKTGTTPPQINLGVKVYAWQEDHEKDSFGDDYDILDIEDEGSGVKDASYTKVENVSAVVADGENTTFVSNMTPAMTGAADDKTTVTIPTGTVGFNTDNTATLKVAATTILPANRTAAFNIVDARGSVGAIDLTVTVNDQVVSEFKDANGADVPVTVTTYIAKGLTLNDKEDKVAIKYVGDNGSDPTLVSYDTDTGKLVFTTTHFSTFAIGADQAAYIEENNTAYLTLYDALDAVAGMENKTATIAMLKDAETVLSPSSYTGDKVRSSDYLINGFVINSGMNVTIDLNGKTISNANDFVANEAKNLFYNNKITTSSSAHVYTVSVITNKGTLTIADSQGDGKVVNDTTGDGVSANGYCSSALCCLYGSTTVINGGAFKFIDGDDTSNYGSAVYVYDADRSTSTTVYSDTNLTINGGSFVGRKYTLYLSSNGTSTANNTINIKGGDFTISRSDIVVFIDGNGYMVEMSGGKIHSDETSSLIKVNKGTFNLSKGTLDCPNANLFTFTSNSVVNVSGGILNSKDNNFKVSGTFNITGGIFNHDYAAYLKEGYTSTANGNGTYTVTANS